MDPTEEVEIRRDQMEGKMFIVAREKQQQQSQRGSKYCTDSKTHHFNKARLFYIIVTCAF